VDCAPAAGPLPARPAGEGVRELDANTTLADDPCRLVRQVKEFDGWSGVHREELLYLPHEAAGAPARSALFR